MDTIVARATAPGEAPIAIVRLSGPGSHAIAARLFEAAGEGGAAEPGHLRLGKLRDPQTNAVIDEPLAVAWNAPRSYTGEDMIEFHTHGSTAVVAGVLDACVAAGARLARPGEFTRRAYLNGKMDLAQAEAVCDLIRAQTDAAGRAALLQLSGEFSRRLDDIRARLVPVVAELEAFVDFPEEGLEFATRERLGTAVDGCVRDLQALADTAQRGRALREGVRLVLAGPPNAGKSSLFNLLLGRERALVAPHPGTTRDTLEAQLDLGGVPATLIDTAGLRENPGEIEALGIARTREEMRAADLLLFLVDASDAERARAEYERLRNVPHLLIANKMDALSPEAAAKFPGTFGARRGPGLRGFATVSARTKAGFDDLERLLLDEVGGRATPESGVLVTRQRHAEAIDGALKALHTAAEGVASELSPEFIVVDLTEAIARLDAITGRATLDEDVLDAIFSTFCLGK